MAQGSANPTPIIQQLRFEGSQDGLVKTLSGFKKSHHTIPDAVNDATTAFLGKLCAEELAAEAENFFQRFRAAFALKRKDINLDVSSPNAVITTKDFWFELGYSLVAENPANYRVRRSLHSLRSLEILSTEAFAESFAGQFTELVFSLTKGAPVEAVIDAIEAMPDGAALHVNYPSDCSHCLLSVDGVEAKMRFDGRDLTMVFPRAGSPAELVAAFEQVRHAFRLSDDEGLSGFK